MWVVLVGWIVLSIVVLIVWMTMRSPWGRVLRAIREDEDAARSLGKNAYWFKMQSLMIGGMFGALGGMFRAIGTQSAQPQNFITDVTFLERPPPPPMTSCIHVVFARASRSSLISSRKAVR